MPDHPPRFDAARPVAAGPSYAPGQSEGNDVETGPGPASEDPMPAGRVADPGVQEVASAIQELSGRL